MSLRDYQRKWLDDIYATWRAGSRDTIATLPTGAGKTFSFVTAIREMNVPACIVTHRMELTAQASLALNREGMPHSIEAPRETVREIIQSHMTTHGRSFYSPSAPVHVAGVHTLASRGAKIRWASSIGLVVVDESHHQTTGGIWHAARDLFTNAVGLGVTAHAIRADGRGLGRGADGMADALVTGPSMRSLINRGFLCDYRVALPPSDIDVSKVPIGASGDFAPVALSAEIHKSKTLVGSVTGHYQRFAAGKLGLTFAVDIASAHEICASYLALGVPAAVITGKTPIADRADMMRRFRARQLLQLVSVDVLGEGTDVPNVEVISVARHTMSFPLHSQIIGRGARVSVAPEIAERWDTFTDVERLAYIAASDKPRFIIIDHVSNFTRHHAMRGLPCSAQSYSLSRMDRGSRAKKSDAIPLRTCLNPECFQPYERTLPACPHCGTPAPAPAGRSTPEQVEGDLVLLDPAAMAALWSEVERVDGPPPIVSGSAANVARGILRNHANRQGAQELLRAAMMLWGGWRAHAGVDERTAQREFFHRFGMDVLTARTLGAPDAATLEAKIRAHLDAHGVIPA